jgi:hypothetical protein
MAEQRLHRIIDAADRTDGEDVAIRKLLVAALSDSGREMARMSEASTPLLSKSCIRHAGLRPTRQLRRARPGNRRNRRR